MRGNYFVSRRKNRSTSTRNKSCNSLLHVTFVDLTRAAIAPWCDFFVGLSSELKTNVMEKMWVTLNSSEQGFVITDLRQFVFLAMKSESDAQVAACRSAAPMSWYHAHRKAQHILFQLMISFNLQHALFTWFGRLQKFLSLNYNQLLIIRFYTLRQRLPFRLPSMLQYDTFVTKKFHRENLHRFLWLL